jgi:hypothetical protein
MSRVEPKDRPKPAPREAEQGRRSQATPGKAEGDEETVEEALRNEETKQRDE